MVNLGALNWFNSFIENLKKALDCINHVVYTPELNSFCRQIFAQACAWTQIFI